MRPGDEVIVFDPAYDSYEPSVTLAGGRTVHIPLITSELDPDFHIDWERLKASITGRTRLIILNFPHNPSGVILSAEDLDTLAEIIRDTGIYLISDEVYEHIVFDGADHELRRPAHAASRAGEHALDASQRGQKVGSQAFLAAVLTQANADHESLLKHDELWERTFVISSFGKTYHATGWKVGYCVAPPTLTTEFRKIHQWVCYAVITPVQHALADYMTRTPDHYTELPAFYQQKRDHFCNLVAESRFTLRPAKGTFFQILDYSEISEQNDVDYAERLTRDIGVASIPVSVFYESAPDQRLLRFCFAKDDDILEEAAQRLCQL